MLGGWDGSKIWAGKTQGALALTTGGAGGGTSQLLRVDEFARCLLLELLHKAPKLPRVPDEYRRSIAIVSHASMDLLCGGSTWS